MSTLAILVVVLGAVASAQDAAPQPADGFGRGKGAVDERAREDARELLREQEMLRALVQAGQMRQGPSHPTIACRDR